LESSQKYDDAILPVMDIAPLEYSEDIKAVQEMMKSIKQLNLDAEEKEKALDSPPMI
jgi:hypothetical protein